MLKILLILLAATQAFASGIISFPGGSATVPQEPAYYYGVGSDSYPNTGDLLSTYSRGDNITVTTGGSITRIGMKATSGDEDDLYISLFKYVDEAWTKHERISVTASLSAGWNDFTLTTAYTVGDAEDVVVIVYTAGTIAGRVAELSGGIRIAGDVTNSATITLAEGREQAVRVYVE